MATAPPVPPIPPAKFEAYAGEADMPVLAAADDHTEGLEDLVSTLQETANGMAGIAATFSAGLNAQRVAAEGSDPSGAITVSIDEHQRVQEVRPHAEWRDLIAVTDVGAAVMAAIDAAHRQQWEAGTAAVELARQDGARAAGTERRHRSGVQAVDLTAVQSELFAFVDALDRIDLDELERRSEPSQPSEQPEDDEDYSIGERRITVRLTSGGDVVAVTVNPRWAGSASRSALGEQLTEAFQEAYADQRPAADRQLLVPIPPELQSIIDSPR